MNAFKKIGLIGLLLFFIAVFGSFVSADYYNFSYTTCCTNYYTLSYGYYNPQGDPSYLRYDPYSYVIDPYLTRSLPAYPYTYYPSYYAAYSYPVYTNYPYYAPAYYAPYDAYAYAYPVYSTYPTFVNTYVYRVS